MEKNVIGKYSGLGRVKKRHPSHALIGAITVSNIPGSAKFNQRRGAGSKATEAANILA